MPESHVRIRIFSIAVGAICLLFLVRAAQLQLLESSVYSGTSRKNSVHTRFVEPARGVIHDRGGDLLADNEPSYTLEITPIFFDTSKTKLLARLLNTKPATVRERLEEAREWNPYKPSRAFRDVPFSVFSKIQENQYRLPGVDYVVDERRRYHGVDAAHVLGYVSEISDRQLKQLDDTYRPGDRIGQAGVEQAYEQWLRGEKGRAFKLVNVHGQEVGSYRDGAEDIPPKAGYNLYLSLDKELQALAETLMVNKIGAAVAIDPQTGGILALASSPDYDPSLLAGKVKEEVWNRLKSGPHNPLFNRATMSTQPPGSTWKPFMALVGLNQGAITRNTHIHCPGGYTYHGHYYNCYGGPHGSITVEEAIKESCNTFFFTLMMRLSFEGWHEWGSRFGFGHRIPTDVPRQRTGILPDSSYFNRQYGEGGWTRGYLVSLGIGQGNLTVTPLQLVRYAGALANGGTLHPPHMVQKLVHPQTGDVRYPELPDPKTLNLDENHMAVVREGMRGLAMEKNVLANWGETVVAGKTGTAQNPRGEDHAWFMAFAPYENPEIAVVVLVEHGGFGASVSAPLAGLMMQKYVSGKISENRKWVYEYVLNKASKLDSTAVTLETSG